MRVFLCRCGTIIEGENVYEVLERIKQHFRVVHGIPIRGYIEQKMRKMIH
ncbi:DUF1059 domain-containing protein [Candidatus Pacearchaeota archaeon]|nr:DUF1059 domain-containing protein [Candidatus Pacearchaeota archaeon]